jgi:class 3 adenylate cyclase/PAS domain-containing protein
VATTPPYRRMSRIGRAALLAACLTVTLGASILVSAQLRQGVRSLQEIQVRELQARGSTIATRMGQARGGAEALLDLANGMLDGSVTCTAPRGSREGAPTFRRSGKLPPALLNGAPCLAEQLRLPLTTGQMSDLHRITLAGEGWTLILEPADVASGAGPLPGAGEPAAGFFTFPGGADSAPEVRYVARSSEAVQSAALALSTDALWAQTFPLSGPEGEVFLFAPDGRVIVRGGALPGQPDPQPLPGALDSGNRPELLERLAGGPAAFADGLLLAVLRLPETDWFLVSATDLPSLSVWLMERNAALLIFALVITLGAWGAYLFIMAALVQPAQRLEDALDRSRTNLTVTFDHVAEGLCLIRADGRIVTANQRLAQLMDLSPFAIAAGSPVEPLLDELGLLSEAPSDTRDIVRPDGRWLEAMLSPVAGRDLSILLVRDVTERKRSEIAVQNARDEAEAAYTRSEELLLNVLPQAVAERLKAGEREIADGHDRVTILFADIVNFTRYAASRSPAEVVRMLNRVFSRFDALCADFGVEKLKTIGDGYMAVAGAPLSRPGHEIAAARLALAMLEVTAEIRRDEPGLALRIGLNSGPAIAGVIGTLKFAYDIWGDAVNVAARLESKAAPGTIAVSSDLRDVLVADFELEPLGPVELKGKGTVTAWRLLGPRTRPEI